jgi:hypothetical protein
MIAPQPRGGGAKRCAAMVFGARARPRRSDQTRRLSFDRKPPWTGS